MNWIDESRQSAFAKSERERAKNGEGAGSVPELNHVLPEDLGSRALPIGNELIIPYEDVATLISVATEHSIAILGFEVGEVLEDGFQVADYSGYEGDVMLKSDWSAYVAAMNAKATDWMMKHRVGQNHGYIVTSSSEQEFYANAVRYGKALYKDVLGE